MAFGTVVVVSLVLVRVVEVAIVLPLDAKVVIILEVKGTVVDTKTEPSGASPKAAAADAGKVTICESELADCEGLAKRAGMVVVLRKPSF